MTRKEQKIADDKVRAEIYRLIEETCRINDICNKRRWYEPALISGTTLALLAIVKAYI